MEPDPKIDYERLLHLMLGESEAAPWESADLPAIWTDLLDKSVGVFAETVDPIEALRLVKRGRSANPPITTLRDLLHHANPPPDMMTILATTAQANLANAEPPIPHAISRVINGYSLLSIRWIKAEAIPEVSDATLWSQLAWMISLNWLDDQTREQLHARKKALH